MKEKWRPGFLEAHHMPPAAITEQRLAQGTAPLGEAFRYARYHRAASWLIEREARLSELWGDMCQIVLPKLRRRPLTRHTIRVLSEYGHGMGTHSVAHGLVHGRPVTRSQSLPEDWRIGLYLGKHMLPTGTTISKAAVVGFSEKVQHRQSRKLQHMNGLASDAGRTILAAFREDLTPDRVRSIWVGRLEHEPEKSWKRGHDKVRNPSMWPQELMSEAVFARLLAELEADPKAPKDPFLYLYQQYGTPEAITRQAESMLLLGKWATQDFSGYLSSEVPPRIIDTVTPIVPPIPEP